LEKEEIGKRFRKLRQHLDFDSGPAFAKELGVSKQTISSIESNGEGLTRERIQLICDKYKIDARYFFEQIDTPEEADLSKRKEDPKKSSLEILTDRIVGIERHVKLTKARPDIPPEAEEVINNEELREIVREIMNWDRDALREFGVMAVGFLKGRKFEQSRERPA
jgi:transcriptional regulator with XRE-family HTH domain